VERTYSDSGMTPVSWDNIVAAWPASAGMWLAAARTVFDRLTSAGELAGSLPPRFPGGAGG
jgi:hypothetical protein